MALAVRVYMDLEYELWVKTGTGKHVRYASVNMTVATLYLIKCVLPFQALTGWTM